ncbi:acyl-[ACP]--phospholipid O-acyltransferase [Nitrospira calida]|jgi:acyl-[acyl-carrier-protein]-phospholipid O-acyltransferase/long-chain-fatty-acid--[acyl-carrier-protein] ligase
MHCTDRPAAHRHPLRGLLIAQFCGAFNDNAWKLIVALLGIKAVAAKIGSSGPAFEAAAQTHTTVAFVAITLPLMLVSLIAGVVADRLSKRTVIIAMKAAEVLLMAAGAVVLLINPSTIVWPLFILGLMGVHSALFSPAKYGILPEVLPHERLSAGNGALELCTFLAIILGTAAGGVLLDLVDPSPWKAGLLLAVCAGVGFVASWTVPRVPPARSEGGLAATIQGAWSALRADCMLKLAVAGAVFFWTVASLAGQDMLVYAKAALGLSDSFSGAPLAVFAVGVGGGAFLAGRLSAAKVEYGLIPLGAGGLALFLGLLGSITPSLLRTLVLMALLGVSSGLLIVPINALIQWRSPGDRRGAVIALSNSFIFGGILIGSLAAEALSRTGFSPGSILLVASLATVAGTAWALRLLPDAFLRLILVLLTHSLYRLRVVGREHVPQEGGALLVPNHISFVDGFLLMASLDRPIRFVIDAAYVNHPLLKPFMRAMRVIPISSSGGPRMILHAFREAGRSLDEGDLVCLFPEGQITRTGVMLPFRRGFERVVKGRMIPIIPVHLDRLWGSIFSYVGGRFLTKWPERIPYPVTVSFGQPLSPDTPAYQVRQAVQELGETAWRLRKPDCQPLHRRFIRAMRRHPFRFAMADATRPRVTCLQALIGAIALARALRPHWDNQPHVGLLLPPSVGGALANAAATLCGKASVNLNYTVGRAGLESACRQAGLRTVVTSRRFVEKAKLDVPEGVTLIWLEDLVKTIGRGRRLAALLLAILAPARIIELACGQSQTVSMDDLATIIFSSGSTGEPKGVMLSHFSIDSNVDGAAQVLHVDRNDVALGILPFFHSFGYLIFWFVVTRGVGIVFHPSPLDAAAIGDLIARYRVTLLVTTPTFLQLYYRRCTPEQLSTLRVIITGAEKLPEKFARAFYDRFGIMPVEGYGVTECAPVISTNVPDFRASGFFQPGSRRGTVGQPLPGVCVRIVDPDTFQPLPPNTPGMLLVKGANVMSGYLGRDDLTAKAMRDGWYVTGDIAQVDEDGFITITDRLSRFSKIGGEMVPHGRVEEALHEAAGVDGQVFAVTSIPDERKGEQLAVLHTLDERMIPEILDKVAATGLSNLFIPRRDHFIKVDALPVLGTGKLDLRALKRIAMERLGSKTSV